ncbi:Peptide transporter PTR1 [Sesbania bispinosa]|nr:Peptide transporter PTR1 [Sesbania bispinosa]
MPCGNPVLRVAQVVTASARKWGLVPAKFMDKAATIIENDEHSPNNPWRLCTVTQVEEAKCVLTVKDATSLAMHHYLLCCVYTNCFSICGAGGCDEFQHRRILFGSMSQFDICNVLNGNWPNYWTVSIGCIWCHRDCKAQTYYSWSWCYYKCSKTKGRSSVAIFGLGAVGALFRMHGDGI